MVQQSAHADLPDDEVLSALGGDDDAADEVLPLPLAAERALPFAVELGATPRIYQEEALAAWCRQQGRGVVVLPTGAGKTMLALMATSAAPGADAGGGADDRPAAAVARGVRRAARAPEEAIGQIGGGRRELRPLTVATYDSASARSRQWPGFGLLVVDEAHHLPAATYRRIARHVDAPYRLGLSATPERADGRHVDLAALIGPEVYRRLPADLAAERHISTYRERRLFVDLSATERIRYDHLMAEYRWYLLHAAHLDWRRQLLQRPRAPQRARSRRPPRPAGAPRGAAHRAQRRGQDRARRRAAGAPPRRQRNRLLGVQRARGPAQPPSLPARYYLPHRGARAPGHPRPLPGAALLEASDWPRAERGRRRARRERGDRRQR